MSVLNRIAYHQGRRDEVPNQELARDLAQAEDAAGVAEIARNLWNKNKQVQSDCIKVLYEVGAIKPELISGYDADFIRLLRSGDNRLVWGAMTALAAITPERAEALCVDFDTIADAMQSGSVIIRDQGVRVLAGLAASFGPCREQAFAALLEHLSACRPKDVPLHSESTLPAMTDNRIPQFVALLERRLPELSASQARRVNKVIKAASSRIEDGAKGD